MSLRVESCRARSPVYMPARDGRAARRLTIGSMEEQGGLRDGRRRATGVSCRLRCQANVAPLQEAGRSLLKQGYRDLTPSERRNRISQHIRHVEHRKLGAVLHGRHLARSRRGRGPNERTPGNNGSHKTARQTAAYGGLARAGRPYYHPINMTRSTSMLRDWRTPAFPNQSRSLKLCPRRTSWLAVWRRRRTGGGRAAAVLHLSPGACPSLLLSARCCPQGGRDRS